MEEKVKWEYKVIQLYERISDLNRRNQEILQMHGNNGWELVGVDNSKAYFKRALKLVEHPEYIDVAQLEAMVTRIVAEQFELGLLRSNLS